MTGDELVRERRGPVLVARLNRPEVRSALNPALIRAIGAVMSDGEADPGIRAHPLAHENRHLPVEAKWLRNPGRLLCQQIVTSGI